MSSSASEFRATVQALVVTDDSLAVELSDGRSLTVPLTWYPRLFHGTLVERANWRLIGRGQGIHWPDLEEDISLAALLDGRASLESHKSLKKWLAGRNRTAAGRRQPSTGTPTRRSSSSSGGKSPSSTATVVGPKRSATRSAVTGH
jgi:hypothetical protein